jgi:uncharacterized protein (DUF1330 family)
MSAYVIVEVSITDAEEYERYKPLASASVAAHGGRYLVRGGPIQSLEGDPVAGRVVVLEFPDLDGARRWYDSDQYRDAARRRQAAAHSRMFIVDGYESAATAERA